MDEGNSHERGVALETLAVKIGRTLGMEFVGWRVRGRNTGGSEVDVVFDDIGPLFNRVQIQCKNTKKQIRSKHVAREVGISRMLQTNSILMIARGGVSSEAKRFSNRVMQKENISIVFLTGEDIKKLDTDTDHLLYSLEGESRRVHSLKQMDKKSGVEEEEEQSQFTKEQQALEKFEDELEVTETHEDMDLTTFTE
ncbi:hypothetical protein CHINAEXTREME_17105 [Halobiforma lacisalsi AJ5]|uniref:Restriction endonuclease type IV Mrr domain-containing protein n=3 Tax=Natronobacterium lacisalsi TaxID=229731 RepID=A0A1P8LWF7_NATLA|nr:hypothetical protein CHINAEXTREME_17105 [Halobiforma lacisalsi AJ5]